jgi:signal peptide peptidase SppA
MSQDEIRARIGAARDNGERTGAAVAVLPLQGVIGPKMNMFMEISGGTSIEQFMRSFRELRDDPSVTAIVCDVDSPGGSVFLLREAFDEIFAARAVKPTVAVVRPICGSAALFIASAFEEIVCTPSGEVGSIGCYMVHEDWSKANEMAGVKPTYISYGDHKVEGNPDEPLSDEALSYLTASVTEFGQDFEKAVAKGRGVSVNYVRENFGQGRMLTAKQAKAAGLVDRVATFEETLARLTSGRGARGAKAADAPLVLMTEASPADLRADAALQ